MRALTSHRRSRVWDISEPIGEFRNAGFLLVEAFRDQLAVKIHRLIAPFHRTSSVPSLELPVNNTFHVRSLLSDLPKVKVWRANLEHRCRSNRHHFLACRRHRLQSRGRRPRSSSRAMPATPRARRRRRACAACPPRVCSRAHRSRPSRRPRACVPRRLARGDEVPTPRRRVAHPSVFRARRPRRRRRLRFRGSPPPPSTLRRSSAACTTP